MATFRTHALHSQEAFTGPALSGVPAGLFQPKLFPLLDAQHHGLTGPGLSPAAAGFGAAWQSLPMSMAMQHLLPHALSMGMHAAGPYAQALQYYAHQQQAQQQQQAPEQDQGEGKGPDQEPAVSGQAQPAQAALLEAAHSAQGPAGGSVQEPLASQDTAAARGGQGALDLLAELAGREMAEMQQESEGARVGAPPLKISLHCHFA